MGNENNSATKKDIVLSISILMSGRKETRDCLESLVPLMQEIPCELILVDTGCDENTRAILEEYTDIIIDFEWCNDFAKARNVGLERAVGEWFMFMDDDEWFEDTTNMIEFFKSGEYKKYNSAYYRVRNYSSMDKVGYKDSYGNRMCKNSKGLIFKSKVHEYLYPFCSPVKTIDAYVHHYGYVYNSEKESQAHSKRNISLIKEELKENKLDLRLSAQLLQEYRGVREYESIIEYANKMIKACDDKKLEEIVGRESIVKWRGIYYAHIIDAYEHKYDYNEMLNYIQIAYSLDEINEITKAFCYRSEVIANVEKKNYDNAIDAFHKYIEMYNLLNEDEEKKIFQGPLFIGSVISESEFRVVLVHAIMAAAKLNNSEVIDKYLPQIIFDDKKRYLHRKFMDIIIEYVLNTNSSMERNIEHINLMKENNYCFKSIIENIRKLEDVCEKEDEYIEVVDELCNIEEFRNDKKKFIVDKFNKAIKIMSYIDDDFWYITYLKVLNYKDDNNKELCRQNLGKLFTCVIDIFNLDNKVWDIAVEVDLEFNTIVEGKSYDSWISGIARWIDNANIEDIKHKEILLTRWSNTSDYRYKYFDMKVREGKLRYANKDEISFLEYEQQLFEYIHAVYDYGKGVYSTEVFNKHTEVLPKECLLAIKMLEVEEERKNGNNSNVIEKLKATIGIYEPFNEVIKIYVKQLGEYIKELETEEVLSKEEKNGTEDNIDDENKVVDKENVSEELVQLAEALKLKVREFIENGNIVEARVVLNQIIQCVPEDEEAKEILSMIEE